MAGGAEVDVSGVDVEGGGVFEGLSGDGVLGGLLVGGGFGGGFGGGLLGDFVGCFFEGEYDEVGEFVLG